MEIEVRDVRKYNLVDHVNFVIPRNGLICYYPPQKKSGIKSIPDLTTLVHNNQRSQAAAADQQQNNHSDQQLTIALYFKRLLRLRKTVA